MRRSNEKCGWAGAEHHTLNNITPFDKSACRSADRKERDLSGSYEVRSRRVSGNGILLTLLALSQLPPDPMTSKKPTNNYPMLAFSYFLRRFVMCPRFCLICFKYAAFVFVRLFERR